MAARAPKQRQLTKDETTNSFQNWRQNITYILSLDNTFARSIDSTGQKKTAANPNRGLADDADTVPEAHRLTTAQKMMLWQNSSFCPVIS